jgi:peptidylprolyl isomerase
MAQAKQGDRVSINFTGTLRDGSVFDTTYGDKCADDGCGEETGPMELAIGEEDFFPEIEKALIGMAPGDRKTVFIPAADAFGEYDEENVFSVGRDQIPGDFVPEAGQELELELTDEEGQALLVTVVEVTDDSITFDANHPLAGEDITYEIELVSIL